MFFTALGTQNVFSTINFSKNTDFYPGIITKIENFFTDIQNQYFSKVFRPNAAKLNKTLTHFAFFFG